MTRPSLLLASLAVSALLGVTGAAHAAEPPTAGSSAADADSAATLSEVVVTAQRREQQLQKVPISISVASGEVISNQALTNLQSVSDRLSSVHISPSSAADVLSIRGIASGNNPGFEQSVATFVDGIYRSRSRGIRSVLFDVDRVEVLKGPQITFFGNNAIAGAFNVTTRKPGRDFSYDASALYAGPDGERILSAAVTLPASDTLSFRFAGQYSGMDGYVDNARLDRDAPNLRDWIGRASMAWTPSDSFRSDLRVDVVRMRDTGTYAAEIQGCPAAAEYGFNPAGTSTCARALRAAGGPVDNTLNDRASGPETLFNYDMVEAAFTNRLSVGAFSLVSTTGYFDHDLELEEDVNPFDISAAEQTATPVNSPTLGSFSGPENYHSFSEELRLESPTGGFLEYTLGAYYSHGSLDGERDVGYFTADFAGRTGGLVAAGTPISSIEPSSQTDSTRSVFAAATLNFTGALRLNLGLRYSDVKKEAHRVDFVGTSGPFISSTFVPFAPNVQAVLFPLLGLNPTDNPSPTRSDSKLMPSASLQYDLTPDLSTYASYANGFKAGGYGFTATPNPFEPERVNAYEVGIRGTLAHRLYFTLSAFLARYDDLQVSAPQILPNGTVAIRINNAAQAESKGLEAGLNWKVLERLTLTSELGYLNSTYVDFPSAPCTVRQSQLTPVNCVQNLSGRTREYAPRWSGSAGASFELPVGEREVRIDPSVYFSSSFNMQGTLDPLTVQDGYAKVDLRVGYGPLDHSWEVALIGKNLADKTTATFIQTVGTSPGTTYALADRGRSVGVQFRVQH